MDITMMKPLRILDRYRSWAVKNQTISDFLNDYYRNSEKSRTLDILEAGCGTRWDLQLQMDYVLTGVDISREAMEIRRRQHGDIDKIVVGDLATVAIPSDAFDVIYCSYVLEHLNGAEAVLDRFFAWLRVGGLAVLLFPDRESVFGFVARMTPHWFHVLYYKYVNKYPHAGKPGRAPFPTYHDAVASRSGIHRYCLENGHSIELEFATPLKIPESAGPLAPLISAGAKLIALGSFGHLSSKHQNLALIIRKVR